jgi:predicted NBD/HSP70 family sugar kinase
MSDILSIDVGYTYTRMAVWDGQGLRGFRRYRTPQKEDLGVAAPTADQRKELWLERLVDGCGQMRTEYPTIKEVALSFPGVVAADGTIYRVSTLWGEIKNDITAGELGSRLGLPVTPMNDLTAAVTRYGANPRYAHCCYLLLVSISSGIGSKLYDVRSHTVHLEPRGRSGEIAFAIVDGSPEALTNDKGKFQGILGNYSSGVGTVRLLRARASSPAGQQAYQRSLLCQRLSSEQTDLFSSDRHLVAAALAACIREGDGFCRQVLRESVGYLAGVLQTVLLFAAPDVLVLVGGFAQALGNIYRETLIEELSRLSRLFYDADELERMVQLGENDDLDNLIGAALRTTVAGRPLT